MSPRYIIIKKLVLFVIIFINPNSKKPSHASFLYANTNEILNLSREALLDFKQSTIGLLGAGPKAFTA